MNKSCKCELVKSWIGIAMMFLSLAIIMFGRQEYYGYLDRYLGIVVVISLVLLVGGAILASAYLQCLRAQNSQVK